MNRFAAWLGAVVLAPLVLGMAAPRKTTGPAGGPPEKAPAEAAAQPVPAAETYADREAACLQNQACKTDSLALPLVKCLGTVRPQKVPAGQRAFPEVGDTRREFTWTVIPWQDAHAEFLDRFGKARSDDEKFQVADWCASKRLAGCTEFVLRDILHRNWGNLNQPTYQKALGLWIQAAPRYASPFVFDLPVRGEWYVEKDTSGLNRRSHGAAFACNLVIQKGGRQYAGPAENHASYFAWGQPVHAIADGRIVTVDDQYPDPPIRRAGSYQEANAVYQDLGGGVHAFYGHIQKGSAQVKVGDTVQRGQVLARVGNSGGNGLPHLHFILLDGDYFAIPGRYRYEEGTPRGAILRDGADLREDTYIRPVPAPPRKP